MNHPDAPKGFLAYATARTFNLLPGLPPVTDATPVGEDWKALTEQVRSGWAAFEIELHMQGLLGLAAWRARRDPAVMPEGAAKRVWLLDSVLDLNRGTLGRPSLDALVVRLAAIPESGSEVRPDLVDLAPGVPGSEPHDSQEQHGPDEHEAAGAERVPEEP